MSKRLKQYFFELSPSTHDSGEACIVVTTEPFDDIIVVCFRLNENFYVFFIPINGGSRKDRNWDPVQ